MEGDRDGSQSHQFPAWMLSLCLLVAITVTFITLRFLRKYCSNLNNNSRSATTNPQVVAVPEEGGDFPDEDESPILDNPIWYIRTVGLQQSVIESIAVFRFKKDEGLIEGTHCSVCLNEFQEDEALRLLPKCSHAFHIACIDTWLRSHKNCPLCRAPIVCNNATNATTTAAPHNINHVGWREDIPEDSSENYGGQDEISEVGIEEGTNAEILAKVASNLNARNCGRRVLSDLGDHINPTGEDLQPVRRSISLDDSEAFRIHLEVANIPLVEPEGCSSTHQLIQPKKPNLQRVGKRVLNGTSSKKRMIKSSSSIVSSLQKGCVAMKRSFSSVGKVSPPRRHSRSQESVLPL
ncbi:hypothetical protein NMG60_11016964 [Bertholletia excelsa]